MNIFDGNTLTLAGGTLQAGPYSAALRIHAGGTLSGFGTINAASAGIADVGTIVAAGGTLMIDGAVGGQGTIDIAAGSTLDINASMLAHVDVDFTGAHGTLVLTHGMSDLAVLAGFSAGDSILMQGVDHIAWSAAANALTLSDKGHILDRLSFAGSYQGNQFTLSQSAAGAVITVSGSH
jgi:hypothetical protein